jgi:hypothetical protein
MRIPCRPSDGLVAIGAVLCCLLVAGCGTPPPSTLAPSGTQDPPADPGTILLPMDVQRRLGITWGTATYRVVEQARRLPGIW